MARTRYFAATDGKNVYFRASPSRSYQSLTVYHDWRGWSLHQDKRGQYPAHEITGPQYRALIRRKADLGGSTAPSDSRVPVDAVPLSLMTDMFEPRYADPKPNDGPARLACLFPGIGSRKVTFE